MKVLITTSSFSYREGPAHDALKAAGVEVIYNPFKRRLNETEAQVLFAEYDPVGVVAGVEPLTERVFSGAPALKAVARCGTGMDSVDKEALKARHVRLSNTPDAPARAVAELTMGLMLGVLRRINEADRALRAGTWQALTGGLLGARTVGLVGYGRIGRRVGDLCAAFGAKVIAHDPYLAAAPVPLLSLDALLAEADIVSLHTAGGAVRLDAARFAAMKKGAIVINCARGDLIDEAALLAALESGHLAGAGLDVYDDEPYSGPLTGAPTALLTAHMGSYAAEARAMQEEEALSNLVADLRLQGVIA